MNRWIILCMSVLVLVGCDRNPVRRLMDPSGESASGRFGEGNFPIYTDEDRTGGGVMLFPEGANQTLDANSRERPAVGNKVIRYTWNGGDVFDPAQNASQHVFAGVALIVASGADTFKAAAPRNLQTGGYTKVSFYVRGSLSANTRIKFEGPDDGNSATTPGNKLELTSLSDSWTQYSFSIASGDLASVKEFFKATLIYTQPSGTSAPGGGGTVFLDQIIYER